VTHDQDAALSMSDQIAILRAGRLIQIGKPQDLFEQPRTHFVADFLGENNFIEGEVIRFVAGCVEFAAGGATFRQLARLQPGQKILMALRPSRIEMTEHEPTEGNRLRGVVIRIQYRGTELQSLVETSLGRLSVLQQAWRSGRHPIPGQSIWLRWSDDAANRDR
jgi:ABC-type Fe3+/spermidine/putrescine transport system ATPase subunit